MGLFAFFFCFALTRRSVGRRFVFFFVPSVVHFGKASSPPATAAAAAAIALRGRALMFRAKLVARPRHMTELDMWCCCCFGRGRKLFFFARLPHP